MEIRLNNTTINTDNISLHFDINKSLLKSNEIKVENDIITITYDTDDVIFKGNWEQLFDIIKLNQLNTNLEVKKDCTYIVYNYNNEKFICDLIDIPKLDILYGITLIKEVENDIITKLNRREINDRFKANRIPYEY